MSIPSILLGQSGIHISALGLGCWGFSGAYGRVKPQAAVEIIHRALELGINFLDTADSYGQGENERLLARALKGRRQKVVLATKFGFVGHENEPRTIDGRPAYVRQALEASLRRLQTDYVDLYYLHRVDKNTPIEETVGAMQRLKEEGKIRAIGLSEAGLHSLEKARLAGRIDALQSEYSLFTQDLEEDILPYCFQENISVVAFSPLGRGMLSDLISQLEIKAGDYRKNLPRFQGEAYETNLTLIRRLKELAADQGVSLAQLALAWLWDRGERVVPIPGTSKIKHLEENVKALNVRFSRDEWMLLKQLGLQARGARHNDANARFFDEE